LRPRRGDAPTEAEGDRGQRRIAQAGNVSDVEREPQDPVVIAGGEPGEAEGDASLKPLARALLALAEQLIREEAP